MSDEDCGCHRQQAKLARRACTGLTLPPDVPDGAVARLVKVAKRAERAVRSDRHHNTLAGELLVALRDLGIGDTK